jgi:hypothetical protein
VLLLGVSSLHKRHTVTRTQLEVRCCAACTGFAYSFSPSMQKEISAVTSFLIKIRTMFHLLPGKFWNSQTCLEFYRNEIKKIPYTLHRKHTASPLQTKRLLVNRTLWNSCRLCNVKAGVTSKLKDSYIILMSIKCHIIEEWELFLFS